MPAIRSALLIGLCLAGPRVASAQKQDSSFANGITAGESDGEQRRRQLFSRMKFDLGFTNVTIGGGLLFDGAGYAQDSISRAQVGGIDPVIKLRDFRFLLNGRFKTRRSFTWQTGIMYDQPNKKWLFRQTGLMVAVPEIRSHFFIGRAKEGFSLNKVMTGYDGWSMERLPFTDATIPLLADGVKWLALTPDRHFFWNLGLFTDYLSKGQSFSSYNQQFVARVGWVPIVSDSVGTLLHVALNFRAGSLDADSVRLRSKPESFTAPYFIDTKKFPATSASTMGIETYYRPGRVMIGGEYYWQRVESPQNGNPWFHGGEFVATWLTTGETRSYNTVGNYFRDISPDKTVIEGGPGAWEAVFKLSYSNLTNGPIQGGTFWRATPMLNWHMTDNVRLEFGYGYGRLFELGQRGVTHFFQSRLQMQL
jgi:phosphate-selective porin OprO/OprP